MIDISAVATGALANAISATAGQLATALRPEVGRRRLADYNIASSFNSYELTERILPDFPDDSGKEEFLTALNGNEVQALIQELLAIRLSDGPEGTAQRLRQQFVTALAGDPYAENVFENLDRQIADLVIHISTVQPQLLQRIRDEAYFTRLNATVETIERHIASSLSGHDPVADRAFVERYRRHIVDHHGAIEPPDFDRRRRVPIANIYVEPTIVEDVPQGSGLNSRSDFDIFRQEAVDRTVLLGNPGGGKTTTSQVILYRYATEPHRPVPFIITLRDFAASDPPGWSVLEFLNSRLKNFYQCEPPKGLVERLLLGKDALVIFDGLDELIDVSRRAEVSSIIEQFCIEYPLSRILVTSRVVGYDEARLDDTQFIVYRAEGFDDHRVRQYVHNWFSLEPNMSETEVTALTNGLLDECADISDLKSNPLMLALICILYRGERSIPRNRADVYEKCAELLFKRWDARRKIYVELKARHLIEPALRYLAYWLLTRDNTHVAVTRHELIAETATYFQSRGFDELYDASAAAEEFVDFCRGRAWVFSDVGSTAAGEQLYTFTHRTFLEYFAACYLASVNELPEKLAQAIAPKVARAEWDMVGQLAVQIKDRSTERGAERIFSALIRDRRRRSDHNRINILGFLARCLAGVQPRSSIIGALTNEMLKPELWRVATEKKRDGALMTLMENAADSAQAVAAGISARIAAVVADGSDRDDVICALILGCLVDDVLVSWSNQSFWADFSASNRETYRAEICQAADKNDLMLWTAYKYGMISASGVIDKSRDDIGRLFRITWYGDFGFGRTSPLISALSSLVQGAEGDINLLRNMGIYFSECRGHPVICNIDKNMVAHWLTDNWSAVGRVAEGLDRGPVIRDDEFAYLGVLVAFCATIESRERKVDKTANRALTAVVREMPGIEEFSPFAICRMTGEPMSVTPKLSVSERYGAYFTDWANGVIRFVYERQSSSG